MEEKFPDKDYDEYVKVSKSLVIFRLNLNCNVAFAHPACASGVSLVAA